jgi:hypothetical protein
MLLLRVDIGIASSWSMYLQKIKICMIFGAVYFQQFNFVKITARLFSVKVVSNRLNAQYSLPAKAISAKANMP